MGVLPRLCLFSFLNDFVLVYPFYALMMQEHGLSAMQLSTLFIAWSVVAFISEVPTGILADIWPRRIVLGIGQLLSGLGWGCWFVFPGYWGFLAGFVLWGIGGSCGSGCFEALVYDELAATGREAQVTRVLGLTRAYAFSGILLAGLCASTAVALHQGYGVLTSFSVAAGLASALVAFCLPPAPVAERIGTVLLLREGLAYLRRTPALIGLVIIIALSVGLYGSLEEYFQLFGEESGLPKAAPGLLMAAIAAVQVLGAGQAWRLVLPPARDGSARRSFSALLLLSASGIALLLSALAHGPAGLIGLLLFCLLYTAAETQLSGRLQELLPDAQRATLGSVSGAAEFWAVLVYLGVGAAADHASYALAFAIGAVAMLLTGLGLTVAWKEGREAEG